MKYEHPNMQNFFWADFESIKKVAKSFKHERDEVLVQCAKKNKLFSGKLFATFFLQFM
jgi:hypothetical protein